MGGEISLLLSALKGEKAHRATDGKQREDN